MPSPTTSVGLNSGPPDELVLCPGCVLIKANNDGIALKIRQMNYRPLLNTIQQLPTTCLDQSATQISLLALTQHALPYIPSQFMEEVRR